MLDTVDDIFSAYARGFDAHREVEMTLAEYLDACRTDPMCYATATERLLTAIGEPEMVDTSKDARLGRIFMNRTIRVYPAFDEFLAFVRDRALDLRFIELMQTLDNGEFFAREYLAGSVVEADLQQRGWQLQPRGATDGPARVFAHPDYRGRIGLIAPYSADFCSSCNRLRVTSRGALRLCLFGNGSFDLRPWLQSPQQIPELHAEVRQALGLKSAGHRLTDLDSGDTRNLATYGG